MESLCRRGGCLGCTRIGRGYRGRGGFGRLRFGSGRCGFRVYGLGAYGGSCLCISPSAGK